MNRRDYYKAIMNGEKKSFIRFGDGEFLCMKGANGKNCDGHPYSRELGDKLINSYIELSKNPDIVIGTTIKLLENSPSIKSYKKGLENDNSINPKIVDINFFNQLDENLNDDDLFHLFDFLRNSDKDKIYVAPDRLKGVCEMLDIDKHIKIPLVNAYSVHENVVNEIKGYKPSGGILFLSCGMMSPYISNEYLKIDPKGLVIDLGSALDPLFVGKTRINQAPQEVVQNYYSKLIEKQ